MVKYKARVLSYVEYRTPAVYHATDTVLEQLDRVQAGFVNRRGLTEVEALVEFRLAPLNCRRDMAMLWVLHRAALKKGPVHLQSFFYQADVTASRVTRLAQNRHNRQLKEYRSGQFLEILRRSALGLVAVYNLLPAEVVAADTVKDFQRQLQDLLCYRAVRDEEDWKETYSPRVPLWRHPLQKLRR